MYRLQITKFEDNPNYKDEMEEYKDRDKFHYQDGRGDIQHPLAQLEGRKLDLDITDEEYQAIKEAVLKTFK